MSGSGGNPNGRALNSIFSEGRSMRSASRSASRLPNINAAKTESTTTEAIFASVKNVAGLKELPVAKPMTSDRIARTSKDDKARCTRLILFVPHVPASRLGLPGRPVLRPRRGSRCSATGPGYFGRMARKRCEAMMELSPPCCASSSARSSASLAGSANLWRMSSLTAPVMVYLPRYEDGQ